MTGQILSKIEADLLTSQKEKDQVKVSTLRFLKAAIHNTQIVKGKENPLEDFEIEAEIAKEVGRHYESIEAAEKAGRAEFAQAEKAELEILQSYLPKQLTEAEISQIVRQAIVQTGVATSADFGKVMGIVMQKVAGRAEGKIVAEVVRDKLQQL